MKSTSMIFATLFTALVATACGRAQNDAATVKAAAVQYQVSFRIPNTNLFLRSTGNGEAHLAAATPVGLASQPTDPAFLWTEESTDGVKFTFRNRASNKCLAIVDGIYVAEKPCADAWDFQFFNTGTAGVRRIHIPDLQILPESDPRCLGFDLAGGATAGNTVVVQSCQTTLSNWTISDAPLPH